MIGAALRTGRYCSKYWSLQLQAAQQPPQTSNMQMLRQAAADNRIFQDAHFVRGLGGVLTTATQSPCTRHTNLRQSSVATQKSLDDLYNCNLKT